MAELKKRKIAVILAGAVAKGAFEAGALAELVRTNVEITQIVAASSGALNGAILAASIHGASDRRDLAARLDALCELWIAHGGAWDAFKLNCGDILTAKGLSDQRGLASLLRRNIKASPRGRDGTDIALRIVVSPLQGILLKDRSSSFESACVFRNEDFETEQGRQRLFQAAVASASFPGAFAPSPVDGLGPCVDGGTVNNTPIAYALADDSEVDAVVVIAPTPPDATISQEAATELKGLGLVGRLADMLINERLHRDLKEARETNEALKRIAESETLSRHADEIKRALGWEKRRHVDILCIRPEKDLSGNPFSGFVCRKLRKEYVAAGRERAKAHLPRDM